MKLTTFNMEKILLSKQGGGVIVRYIFEERPSDYVPFKGTFPLLPAWRQTEYYNQLDSHEYLEDCPDWMQTAVLKGEQMVAIDQGFQDWLQKNGKLDNFFKLSKSDKASLLVKFMDENCLDIQRLQIN